MKEYKIKNGIFVPYSFVDSKMTYFDSRPSMSYGTKTVVWIGARRIGKTYAAKSYGTKRYFYRGHKMVWLRDNDEARKKLASNKGKKFFSDYTKGYENFEGKIDGETIIINDETFGYLMPTSTFQNYKGNDYDEIKTLVYDEFIPEHGKNVRASRTWEFINSLYTILSTRRDAKVLMLANALDRGDEILELFGFRVNEFGIYVNRKKDVCLHYCDNSPEFNEQRDNSIVGKFIEGTPYEDNLFHNKFADDENMFYDKRPQGAKLVGILHTADAAVRVYFKDGMAYCCRDFSPNTNNTLRFVNDYTLVNTRLRLIPQPFAEAFRRAQEERRIMFDRGYSKNVYLEFIKKR